MAVDSALVVKLKINLGFSISIEKDVALAYLFSFLKDFSENRLTKIENRIKELLEPITQAEFLLLEMDESQIFGKLHYKPNTKNDEWYCINDILIDEITKGII